MEENLDYFDVIIVGAGLSGIGAAHHLQTKCPNKSYTILEARHTIGGTWDLFKYPGIRSDSDMYTLGYSFRPWKEAKAIADGPSILKYIKDTAQDGGIDKNIRYHHEVTKADWSSEKAEWLVEVKQSQSGETIQYRCNFLFMCSGYYNYDEGFTPDFKGADTFKGQVVHPQKWTEDIDYEDKKVVVIGSGATAVTLVPELGKKAEHVVMLQRSPTYIVNAPSEDIIANFLRKILPLKLAFSLTRWKNIIMGIIIYKLCRSRPEMMKKFIKKGVGQLIDDPYFDLEKHFSPKYNPWDQRLCLVPDGDLFESINEGKSSIITDHIEAFTPSGILLKSGKTLDADLIVTATGLKLKIVANLQISVDNQKVNLSDHYVYRGMMFNNIPNFAMAFGYTNASWTLKADLSCEYVCRLLNHMDKSNTRQVIPIQNNPDLETEPVVDFNSGYVLRSLDHLPKQGVEKPWRVHQNYAIDIFNFRYSKLNDGVLDFK